MHIKQIAPPLLAAVLLSACSDFENGQYTTSTPSSVKATAQATQTRPPEEIELFAAAPPQAYTVLGPLKVNVNKLTAFHPNPTVADAEERLRREAAKLGADAVINVSIGEVRVTGMSWGARRATGTAIKF